MTFFIHSNFSARPIDSMENSPSVESVGQSVFPRHFILVMYSQVFD
ncbi:MAG TPA: hypothetical protein VGK10_11655 [Prolixibacteraceae bacterium]